MRSEIQASGRQTLLSVVLVLLVLLAGCSGGTGATDVSPTETDEPMATETTDGGMDGGDSTTTDQTTAKPGSTATDTPDPTATPTPEPTATPTATPVGVSSGDLDVDALTESHGDALDSQGSYGATYEVTLNSPNGTIYTLLSTDVNYDTGRSHGVSNLTTYDLDGTYNSSLASKKFIDGDTVYEQTETYSNGMPFYFNDTSTVENALNASSATPGSTVNASLTTYVELWLVSHTWEEEGRTTYDGDTVTEYTAAAESLENYNIGQESYSSVDIQTARVLVGDGAVRHMEFSMSATNEKGESVSWTVVFSFTGLGSTSVETPQWVDDMQ